jgi:cytochrome c553
MAKICLLISILIGLETAWATSDCPTVQSIDSRDVTGLEKYISSNDFKSLDCVIASLPSDVRAFRTYLKKSLSMQEASPKNPRALVGSPDGGFFLTFNGHKAQKGYNEIEFLALDNNKSPNRWVPGTITVTNGKVSVNKNVSTCSRCHGSPVRPIWGNYPRWTNVYGSIDDWMPDENDKSKQSLFYDQDQKESGVSVTYEVRLSDANIKTAVQESRQFREFRKYAATHARYSALEKESDPSNPVHPFTEVYRTTNHAFRPNLILGAAMTVRQQQIVTSKIKQSRFFKTFKTSLLHYFSCRDELGQNEQNENIYSFIEDAFQYRHNKNLTEAVLSSAHYSKLSKAYDLLGILKHERTLLFADGDHYLPSLDQGYFSGYGGIVEKSIQEILVAYIQSEWPDADKFVESASSEYFDFIYNNLAELKKSNPKFPYIDSKFFGKNLYSFLNQGPYPFKFSDSPRASVEDKQLKKAMCEHLATASKDEMKKNPIAHLFVTQLGPQKNIWPRALNSCISCHDSKDRVAIWIPFSNPKKLAQFNSSYMSMLGYGNLLDATEFYIGDTLKHAHEGGTRMPLGREPLNPKEQKEVLDWIQKAIRESH